MTGNLPGCPHLQPFANKVIVGILDTGADWTAKIALSFCEKCDIIK